MNKIAKLSNGFPRLPLSKDFNIFFSRICQDIDILEPTMSKQKYFIDFKSVLFDKQNIFYLQLNKYFHEIMSVCQCRTIHYLLTATTRGISFDRQWLYMKGYDDRPLGHVGFRQVFSFPPTLMVHPLYANSAI